MAQRALTLVRLAEGRATGLDRPAAWTRRSSSARSSGNSPEAAALETSTPYLNSHRRLVGYCKMGTSHLAQIFLLVHIQSDEFLFFFFSTQYFMELTFTQAAKGVNKEFSVNMDAACQRCDGKGHEPGTKVQHCHHCNGSGMVRALTRCLPSSKCVCVVVFTKHTYCPHPVGDGKHRSVCDALHVSSLWRHRLGHFHPL